MRPVGLIWTVLASGCCVGTVRITASDNYMYEGELTIADQAVASKTNLIIDWSALTLDLRGGPFDGTPDQVLIARSDVERDTLLSMLQSNTMSGSAVPEVYLCEPEHGARAVATADCEIVGNAFDPSGFQDGSIWVPSLIDIGSGRDELLAVVFFSPTKGEENTVVAFDDNVSVFDHTVQLGPAVPHCARSRVLDWSSLTKDVFGHPWDTTRADELVLASFDTDDPATLETDFPRLEDQAIELYRLNVFGLTSANVALASDAEGNPFAGFTGDGTWLWALGCTSCTHPAPLALILADVH